jgi:hypothetical protein
MTISAKEKLIRLEIFAGDMEIEVQSAHSEACRLAEIAVEARKHAAAAEATANEAFDKAGRISDRAEGAAEALAAFQESIN